MADHLRQQIRDAVIETLETTLSPACPVYASRRVPLAAHHLPAVLVYTLDETSAHMTMGSPRHLARELNLVVQVVVQDNDTLDDTLDGWALAVETALAADRTVGGLAFDIGLTQTAVSLADPSQSEVKTGSIVLTWRVSYRSRTDDPSTIN